MVIDTLLDLLFPRTCHLCGVSLAEEERYVCTTCLSRMLRTLYHLSDMNRMEQRFAGLFPFEHASGHFFYSKSSDLSQLMQDLKYRHFGGLAEYLGEVAAKELYTTSFLNGIDIIVPVPMHFFKKAKRGYNQTELIAKGFSRISGIPVSLNLRAVRPHRTQTALSLTGRRENTKDLFAVKDPSLFAGKHLLLLDDVCTTGSTLTSAATAILAACPTSRLSLFTLGVTY